MMIICMKNCNTEMRFQALQKSLELLHKMIYSGKKEAERIIFQPFFLNFFLSQFA